MSSGNVFERLRGSFQSGVSGTQETKGRAKPDMLTRYFGGHTRDNHPFVSGYWQLILDPPDEIFSSSKEEGLNWYHCTAEGFTPPSRTLNKGEVPGQGGLGSSYVTGQTLTRNFTCTFREYQDLPIFNLIELWCSVIDPYTGVSPLAGEKWVPKSYKGSAMVILTKPTRSAPGTALSAKDLEQVLFFQGVFPESPPYDTLGADIQTNDVIQHNITFSFDGWPLTKVDDKVVETALNILNSTNYFDKTYKGSFLGSVGSNASSGGGAGGVAV